MRSIPSLEITICSIGMSHWVRRRGHMNTHQDGETSQRKIIPIKRHFASLIFGIISPSFIYLLVCVGEHS